MKREEIEEMIPGITKEQIDALLDKAGGEIDALKARHKAKTDAMQAQIDEASAAIAERDGKIAESMSAEERMAAREEELAAKAAEFARKSNELDAKAIFVAGGVPDDKLGDLLANVVSDDAGRTKALAEAIVATMGAKADAVTAQVKDELLRSNPTPPAGTGGGTGGPATMKEFLALPYSEQLAIKKGNPNILSDLK